ncbi:MAG: LemA family protein [Alphaproteobacteria bacterium]|nr:LemA family protein [Alphaproteobacteria bacterium]
MNTVYVVVAIAVLSGLYGVSIYNRLVKLKNRVLEAWSDIEVQMKRRYNLIPNLVETVKGYAAHEQDTLEKVIQARNMAMGGSGSPEHQAASENMLSGALKSLFALSEDYPDLKANTQFLKLQDDLAEAEDLIQKARRYYNGSVRDLNVLIEQFPSNVIAGLVDYETAEYFEIDETDSAARSPVQVKF